MIHRERETATEGVIRGQAQTYRRCKATVIIKAVEILLLQKIVVAVVAVIFKYNNNL